MFNRIYIEITNVCNLNCAFCPNTNREKKFMTSEEFSKIMKKIKSYTNHIYLHVKGEPLIHPELDSILKIASNYNVNVNITTNAICLKDKLDIIKNNKVRQINISLHSFDNMNDIKDLLNVIDEIKNTNISLRLWNNCDNKEVLNILGVHYNKEIDLKRKRFTLADNVFLDNDSEFEWPDIKRSIISETGTCLGAKKQLGVLVDGSVVPCCLDNDGIINLGNIFDSDLESIINSDRYKNIVNGFNNNKLVEELCKKCQYRTRFNKEERLDV